MKIYDNEYDIYFDSELEQKYYHYLKDNGVDFMYQTEYKNTPIQVNIGKRKNYTCDFIEEYENKVVITETKGYSKWSGNIDNEICDFMKHKAQYDKGFIVEWLARVGVDTKGKDIEYQRIKYNKTYGWVDYDFKNPNTIANKRKNKIIELEQELKELKAKLKDYDRYVEITQKLNNGGKPTKLQLEFYNNFRKEKNI